MRRYRRARVPGGWYFFTVNLHTRDGNDLLVRHIDVLRASVRTVRREHPFAIDAMVVLPDHLHALWRLPPGDDDFPTRWRLIKAGFSRAMPAVEPVGASRARRGERAVWQRRYWEHLVRDEHDWQRHVDYIHFNPVKHGYVGRAVDWPWSSVHRFVRAGWIDGDWGASEAVRSLELE